MPNQTLVSVPTKFDEFKQVRAFAVKLVEKLDLVLGFRGQVGNEEAGTAELLVTNTLTSLAQNVSSVESVIDSIQASSLFNEESLGLLEEKLITDVVIADTAYTAPTISASYLQAEVQGLADNLEVVSDKLDVLLAALRSAEIIQ